MIKRLLFILLLTAQPVLAQDAEEERDRGFLAGLIEDNLSSPGLSVRIDGFSGALSSKASLQTLTVADDQGVWLRMEDVVLDWNRSALLRGRLEVEELSAALIRVDRTPLPAEGVEALPDAGASKGFSLPDLPVSIDIAALQADRIELGAPLLGQEVALSLDASAQLSGGSGSATIQAQRLDGPTGRFRIQASYAAETQDLAVDLDVAEAEGGIAATLLKLPGAPAIELTVKGQGPLDGFAADIDLASDGQERLGGQITLTGTDDGRRFDVDLGGDVTPLFAPRYRDFFGDDVSLAVSGLQRTDGRLDLDALRVDTRALTLEGQARIGDDGFPTFLDVTGRLAAEDGTPVLLPVSNNPTLTSADLTVSYDASVSDRFTLDLEVADYSQPDLTLADGSVTASGTFERADGAVTSATAAIDAALDGLDFTDPALAQAVGPQVALTTDVAWQTGQPVRMDDLALTGTGYDLAGTAQIASATEETPLTLGFDLTATIADLTRLAGISGQDLSGAAKTTVSGSYAPTAGGFDVALDATTQGLAVGIAQADAVLAGETVLTLAARRTVDGTFLDSLDLSNDQLTATGNGAILAEEAPQRAEGQSSRATFQATLADGTALDPRLDGAVEIAADVSQDAQGAWAGTLDAMAPEGITLSASGTLTGEMPDLSFAATVPRLEPFAPGVPGGVSMTGRASAQGDVWSVDVTAEGPYDVSAKVSGTVTGPSPEIDFQARLPELTAVAPALADTPALSGPVALDGTLTQDGAQWSVDTSVEAPSGVTLRARGPVTGPAARIEFASTVPQVQDFVPPVEGRLDLDGAVARTGEDWAADVTARGPYGAVVTARTVLTATPLSVDFTADLADLSQFAPVPGGLSVEGTAVQTGSGYRIDVDGTGPYAATLDATVNLVDGVPDIAATGRIPEASALAPQLSGPLDYDVTAAQSDGQWRVDASVDGAQALTATVTGIATGPEADLDFRVTAGNVAAFAPGLDGPLDASGRLFQDQGQWNVDVDASGPLGARLDAQGVLTGAEPNATFDLSVPDIGPLVPDISGPLRVQGTARQQGDAYAVDVDLDGPSGTNAAVAGTVGTNGQLDLSATGSAPLGLANPALSPNRIAGTVRFDIRASGPPALDSVTGTISTADATFVLPTLRNGLDNIDATIDLAGGRAQVDLTASPQSGGTLSVTGPVTLSAPFDADLAARFDVTLEDPSLYTAQVAGQIAVTGPLTGGARIAGNINIDGAKIVVPSSGLTAVGDLPEITHIATPRPVQRTLERAGQIRDPSEADTDGGASGPGYGLDLTINAPGRIFIRGRGLDAELGGNLRLTGTTNDPITQGGFELVRGRLDILQKRFNLDEGTITFQGDLIPYLRLVAATQTDTITASIVIEGPADDIQVSFESSPTVPQEEIVAQIFFGRDLSQLSPFQAVQLANSIAVLAGRGQAGLLDNLRGSAGLDDLDVTTDDEGNVGLRAGKYVSDNVYTDVEIDQNGDAAISLNLDVTPSLKLRGSTGASGNAAVGLFFERDY